METPPATESTARPTASPGNPPARDGVAPSVHDVFLSYRSSDHERVEHLAAALRAEGFHPFLDRWNLTQGRPWRPELEEVLATCRSVAVLVGPDGLGEVQQREVDVALRRQDRDRSFRVIPVLLPGATAPEGFLAALTWVDLRHLSDADSSRRLAEVLRGAWGAEASLTSARQARRAYLINLALLLIALVLAALWYHRHLEGWWGEWAIGGTLTVAAFGRLLITYLQWGAETAVKDLPRRLLTGRRARLAVGLLAATAALALGTTSSLHVRLDPALATRTAAPLAVEWRTDQASKPLHSTTLDAGRPRVSRLYFLRFGKPLTLGAPSVVGRDPLALTLRPWASHTIAVPSGLPLRTIPALRLLPGPGLAVLVGRPGDSVLQAYDLLVTHGGITSRVEGFRAQSLVLAATAGEAVVALERESSVDRGQRYRDWAGGPAALADAAARETMVSTWDESPRFTSDPALGGVDLATLRFTLAPSGAADAPIVLRVVALDTTNALRSVLLEH